MRSYTDLPRAARLTIFLVVAVFALSAIVLLIFRVARSGALPGTTVAGVGCRWLWRVRSCAAS